MAETPEQESKRVTEELKNAAASGDIHTIVKVIANTSSLSPTDFIQKTVGSLLYVYYMYVDRFHTVPTDIDDMIDGILYIEAHQYNVEKQMPKDNK